jgi:hypothetical protein
MLLLIEVAQEKENTSHDQIDWCQLQAAIVFEDLTEVATPTGNETPLEVRHPRRFVGEAAAASGRFTSNGVNSRGMLFSFTPLWILVVHFKF